MKAKTYYQIYQDKQGNKVGKFLGLIPAKSVKEALKISKRIFRYKLLCVRDYGIRFFIPLTKGVFYYK